VLTATLRTLERSGLVTRSVTPTVPVRVDYALTALALDLLPFLGALGTWAEHHAYRVQSAQEGYDRAHPPAGGVSEQRCKAVRLDTPSVSVWRGGAGHVGHDRVHG
jgi:hypothetical protein